MSYIPPKKMVPIVDCEQVLKDLHNGPLTMSHDYFSSMKVVGTYMRGKFETLRLAFKTVTFVHADGREEVLLRVSLVDTPVRVYGPRT